MVSAEVSVLRLQLRTTWPADGVDENAYLTALEADLDASLPLIWGRRVVTVFIGGGTPSLFSGAAIDRLLASLRARLPSSPMPK